MTVSNVAQPDLTLLLDYDGVIRSATLFNAIANEGVDAWFGRPWTETVGESGIESVRRMVEDARVTGVSAFGQVTQRFPSGLELPIEYTAVRLGGKSGLLAIGRNVLAVAELQSRLIAAQQAMERDYWKLRQVETRYRLLFDSSTEAVMVIDSESLKVIEANPAAIRAVGIPAGEDLMSQIAASEREGFRAMLSRTYEQKKTPGHLVHLGPARKPWVIRASLMMAEPGPVFLLQLSELAGPNAAPGPRGPLPTDRLIDRLPDAFIVLDREGVIHRANRAFLDLVQAGSEGAVTGEHLSRWLTHPGADALVLLSALRRHRTIRNFRTRIEGELGAESEVEITAADDQDTNPHFAAALIRNRQREKENAAARPLGEIEAGKSLRDLVRAAISSVERNYIASALEKAEGNRTVASELLGLSRQTLYSKMDRYGLNGASSSDREERD